jgi:hypothetical protein
MRWRRGSKFILANSVVVGGQDAAIRIDDDSTLAYFHRGTSAMYNSYLHNFGGRYVQVAAATTIAGGTVVDSLAIATRLDVNYFTKRVLDVATLNMAAPFNNAAPNLLPTTGSPLLAGAKFDFGTLADAFFEKVTYVGAFDGTTNWTTGWAVFNK